MRYLLTPLLLLLTACNALEEVLPGQEIGFKLPILVWSNQYIVDKSQLRTSGIFCPIEEKCNVLMADAQYEVVSGRWTNSALVTIRSDFKATTAIEEYNVDKDACFTDETLKRVSCSPNFVINISGVPNDELWKDQWDMQQLELEKYLNSTTPLTAVSVAVIDTGILATHSDLSGQVTKFYDAIQDKEVQAYDDNGHGTHVAGTIAAISNNQRGVAGMASHAKLIGAKFLSASGSGQLFHAIRAIDWAVANGANIINASWGGGGYSQPLHDSIKRAASSGVLFIAAAGNEGVNNDKYPHYPSNYESPNIISVAATDQSSRLASFSNFGKKVHVAAPGVAILSTCSNGSYCQLSGTSMATPHVSGLAAIILARYPNSPATSIIERILRIKNIPGLEGKVGSGGIINIGNALGKRRTCKKEKRCIADCKKEHCGEPEKRKKCITSCKNLGLCK